MNPKAAEPKPESQRRERQDWLIVLLILLLGFLCVICAAQSALRFAPNWALNSNMQSGIDPNSDFETKPSGPVEPIDAGILTQPAWVKVFLTPGARFVTGTPPPSGVPGRKDTLTAQATNAVPVTNTLPVATLTNTTNTVAPTNTLIWYPPPAETWTPKPKKTKAPPPDTAVPPTAVPPPNVTLLIDIYDNATGYAPGTSRIYTLVVTNPAGSDSVVGATVQDLFPGQITGFIPVFGPGIWCQATGSAICGTWSGAGNINDVVSLPTNSTITYQFEVTTAGGGDLVNTASASLPAGYTGPSPVSDTDTDTYIAPVPPPFPGWGTVGTPPGTGCNLISVGQVFTFSVPAPIVDGVAPDLIYYEELQTVPPGVPGILMDKIIIEVSDGLNWVTVLNWGDNAPNGGTNLPSPANEYDNYPIDGATLIDNTGIGIDIPDSLQNGPTTYIRVSVPNLPPDDGSVCIDAFVPAP